MKLVHQDASMALWEGDCAQWVGRLRTNDLVLTTPQGPLPPGVFSARMIVHMGFAHWALTKRVVKLREWLHGVTPTLLGTYNHGKEHFYGINLDPFHPVNFDHYEPGEIGSWPEALVVDLLADYGQKDITVWDGFMGRGTVGKVATKLGMKFIGIEKEPANMSAALDYLGIAQ